MKKVFWATFLDKWRLFSGHTAYLPHMIEHTHTHSLTLNTLFLSLTLSGTQYRNWLSHDTFSYEHSTILSPRYLSLKPIFNHIKPVQIPFFFTSLSLSTSQGFSVSLYLNNLCVSVFFVYFFFCVFLYFTICVSLSIANLFSTLTFSLSIYLSDPISQSNSLCSSLFLSLSSCLLRCACFSPSLYLTVCIYLSLSR